MKGKFWRKALAASLALLIVSGSVPIKPISNVFESMIVTADAVEEVTKTFTIADVSNQGSGLTTILYDGNDFLVPISGMQNNGKDGSGITMRSSAGAEGIVRLYPRISGNVKSISFSSAKVDYSSTVGAGSYIKIGKGNVWSNSYSETMSSYTTMSFSSENGMQLENENDYLEIRMKNTNTTRNASFFIKGTLTITYEPTASTLTHTHNFSYSKNGSTLTATCAHDDGKDCELASSNYQISTTLTPPTHATYAQYRYHSATLSDFSLFSAETGATAGDITYVNNTTGVNIGTSMPHDIGAYTASVTVNAGGTDYTLTTSYSVGTFCGINTNYPQFTTDKEGNYALDGDTVTLTFTPQFGETLTGVTATGTTSGNNIALTPKSDNSYTFTMPQEDVNIGATFSISENDFAQTGENEYTIKTNNGWNWFCFALNYGLISDGFSDKTVKLATDVESSEMAGTSNHPFKGTFDGQNHTLTFNRTATEHLSAPFHCINGATISNLHVEGTITGGTYESLGGLVGRAEGNITIENCHVSTQISTTVSGSALHGGVIAQWNSTNATCTVTGCVYDGLIYNPDEAGVTTSCRGFIGWDYGNNGTITFTDCLSAPAAYGTGKYALGDNCCTFVYPNSEPTLTYSMTNCYYTNTLGNRQGRPAATATTKPANLGAETTNHGLVKGYENGFLYNGNYYTPKYGDAVVDYDFDEWNERASVTFNGDGYNLVGVNITEEVGNIKSVTYNRTFTPGATTTVILPFNYECNGDEGGTFYNFKEVTYDEDKHEWVCKIIAPGEAGSNNVTSLTANTPYLFVPTATKMTFPNIESMTGGVVTLQPTTLNEYGGATTNDNLNFYGTYTGKIWTETETSKDYGFAAQSGTAAGGAEVVAAGQFVRYAPGAIIGPMRCYLRYAGNGELEDTYTVANPGEGDPVRNVPWWDGNDGYESTEIFDTVAYINITAPTNGSITAKIGDTSASTAHYGDTVTLDVTPDTGYAVKSVKYNGTEATKNADGTYSFEMPAKDVTVTAVFGHTVAIDNNITNGTVSADLPVAEKNEAVTLTVTPAAGYAVKSVKVGNTEIEPVNGVYSFTMPDNDVTVTAEFEAITYSVAFNKNSNDATGSMDNQSFTGGTAQALTANGFTAPTGYHFAGWATSANGAVEYADGAEVSNLTAVNNDTVTLYAKWEANKHTVTYKVDGEVYGAVDTVAYGTALTAREAPTKTGYTFSGWSEIPATMPDEDVVITGSFIINKYAVTWKNGDTTLETDTNVPYGTAPSYDGATPTKAATAQYSYTFSGWSDGTDTYAPAALPTVSGNVTYTAQFDRTVNEYTITWVDGDGNTLKTEQVAYGETPAYTGDTPTKTATAQYSYTFKGWGTITAVTANVTYTAQFDSEVNKYTVTWLDGDGKTLKTEQVAYGETPAYTGDTPTKAATAQYSYTFKGWGTITAVTGNATYTAQFDSEVNKYTITWKNGDTVLETDTDVEYGTEPHYDGATPTKASTSSYTYSFAGWSPEISDVTGNVTYTAQFSSTAKSYTITYKVDGEIYKTESVSYGNSITLPDAPTKEGYTFSGWQTSYTTMPASNIEITGTFEINTYAVTYMVDGAQYGDSATVEHGTKLTAPEAPTKNGAIFLGWTADGVNAYDFETPVTAETTLTAMWLDASGFITFSEGYAVTDDTYNGTDRDYVGFRFDVNMDNSNYTVVQHGILYGMNIATFSDGKADANLRFTDEEATALMDKVREFAAQNTDTETTDWIEVYIGDRRDGVVYARGFIIVTDGTNNYLIYSDVQEGSYNSFSE